MYLIKRFFSVSAAILLIAILLTACATSKSNPVAGRAAGKNNFARFNPVHQKAEPLRKKFVIRNGNRVYLGQVKPK